MPVQLPLLPLLLQLPRTFLAFSASSCARLSFALMPPTVEVTPCTYLQQGTAL
jgi:hypothetical protein